jgi:hypothetical protein
VSYCRFGEADVYIFPHIAGGIECCACPLHTEGLGSYNFATQEEVLDHIAEHRQAGHYVPEFVDEELKKEIADRNSSGDVCDAFVPPLEREESYLSRAIGLPLDDEIAPISPSILVLAKALQHLREREQYIADTHSEDFRKGYIHAIRELEFYREAGRVL